MGSLPVETQTVAAPRKRGTLARLIARARRLSGQLVLPYLGLVFLLALTGVFFTTRFVSTSSWERLVNQLYQSARIASDTMVEQEASNLTDVRTVSYTDGVADAVQRRDVGELQRFLETISFNRNVETIMILDRQGYEMLTMNNNPETGGLERAAGADFSAYPFVQALLQGIADDRGDKYVEMIPGERGPVLLTGASIFDLQTGEVYGVGLVGVRLQSIIDDIKSREDALVDVFFLDNDFNLLAASVQDANKDLPALQELGGSLSDTDLQTARIVSFPAREYQVVFTPLIARDQQFGWVVVRLPTEVARETSITNRSFVTSLFGIAALAVVLVGLWTSRRISTPIVRLNRMTQSVAAGDLNQELAIKRPDEIGELANAFDIMTLRLRERTAEAARLYEEAVRRNQELADTNERLRSTQQQLIQSEKLAAIGQLTAGIVHDVKNPLTVIKGVAELLLTEDDLGEELRSEIALMRESAVKANNIVTDLLKFSRQSKPELEIHDMRETVEAALRLTAFPIRKAHVQVTRSLPERPVMMIYDDQQVEQVLVNMISNAVQAMPTGGMLRVSMLLENGQVAIAIQDTGIGIPPENLSRIFDPFFTTKPVGEGTGLGLSVSYGIISNHNGRIEVNSVVGQGTTFTILLPLRQMEMAEATV